MRKITLTLAIFTLAACTTPPSPSPGAPQVGAGTYIAPAAGRTALIPEGTHRHTVKLKMKQGTIGGRDEMSFSGILDIRKGKVVVLGLTPFGSTLFKMTDDLKTGVTTFESPQPQMAKAEPFIKEYYAPLRKMLLLPYPPKIESKEEGDAKFTFLEYDANDLPRRMKIETPKFDLDIKEEGYEP